HLNAGRHPLALRPYVHVPGADRVAASAALLRLDPRAKHTQMDLTDVDDLRALWNAAEAAEQLAAAPPAGLYPLAASAKAMAASDADPRQQIRMRMNGIPLVAL